MCASPASHMKNGNSRHAAQDGATYSKVWKGFIDFPLDLRRIWIIVSRNDSVTM